MNQKRDHGGGIDAAILKFGGTRRDWLDLSTGINPVPYPVGHFAQDAWTALPDARAFAQLEVAARHFWKVPDKAAVLATPGASAAIAQLPNVMYGDAVNIAKPTYNEHEASFRLANWALDSEADVTVAVHPNNPDGRLWAVDELGPKARIIDESFCDVAPDQTLIKEAEKPGTIVLKSFGKFWGLAGLRLGFAIGDPSIIDTLASKLGPWQVSGPALEIGANALQDQIWADQTRDRLRDDSARLDDLMRSAGVTSIGGTTLFRLYDTDDAENWQTKLAKHHVWSRVFPYSDKWLRLGIPHPDRWSQLEGAL